MLVAAPHLPKNNYLQYQAAVILDRTDFSRVNIPGSRWWMGREVLLVPCFCGGSDVLVCPLDDAQMVVFEGIIVLR